MAHWHVNVNIYLSGKICACLWLGILKGTLLCQIADNAKYNHNYIIY